ncbi:MAG: sensor histidine kinase [Gemmatimonadales bacterium]
MALAVGMVILVLAYLLGLFLSWQIGDWPFFVYAIAAYIGLALGAGWFSEVRAEVTQRERAEHDLRRAYTDLRKSHFDLQLAQWKLIEVEKLEAVGQLAAGVAHEVKNPLMALITAVQYLSQRFKDDEEVQGVLDDMRTAVHRADAVIRGLLDFSSAHELDTSPQDLNDLVEKSALMVKHEFTKNHVKFAKDLTRDLPKLELDSLKVQQVLVNVFTNAAHATPAGGRITARTYVKRRRIVVGEPEDPDNDPFATGARMVVLEVDDTGTGIPEDQLAKLYDPFFTTKPTGQGTGLGLSVSRQIVEMHGGTIDICNREEGGARVTIVFDVPEEETQERKPTNGKETDSTC